MGPCRPLQTAPGPSDDGTISIEEIEDAVVDGDSPVPARTGTARAALSHRTFRIVFLGAFASNIGTWMQNVVLGAYAYDLTHSSTFVGRHHLRPARPDPASCPWSGGLLADKIDRKRFLIVLSLEQLVFSLGVALVVLSPHPSKVLLVVMVLGVGAGARCSGPPTRPILPGLVGKEDLPGAISLNSAQMNASRVIGPVIGGAARTRWSGRPGSSPATPRPTSSSSAALLIVTLPRVPQVPTQASRWRQLTAGITVARQDKVVGRCLVTVFVFSLLALAFIGQMPVVAAHNLGIDLSKSADYGILYACFGIGRPDGRHLHRDGLRPHVQADAGARLPRRLLALALRLRAATEPVAGRRRPWPSPAPSTSRSSPRSTPRCRPGCTRTCGAGSWRCG